MRSEIMSKKNIEILLVEDNPGDVRLVREAFSEVAAPYNISVVEDGMEAMGYLNREDQYTEVPRPDLIILDLNLPKKDGREVLREIKSDEVLKRIPVVILSASSEEEDILRSYNLHANCYIAKPVGLEQFIELIRYFEEFWLKVVTLPGGEYK
jgi:chemotaxis family two-component system response regulator Rcp1